MSESSLKRWCDQGLIPIEKTPGGHRRIRLRDALQFIRDRGDKIIQPELLGLPAGLNRMPVVLGDSVAPLTAALDSGAISAAREIVFGSYLARAKLSEICDQLLTPAMHQLGYEWQCGRLEVFQERRACEVVNQLLFELQGVAPRPAEDAPVAVGGALEGDQYRLATQMVALALVEEGWNAESLGSNLPFETLHAAAESHRPRVMWLSVSMVEDPPTVQQGITDLVAAVAPETSLVVGGQAITQETIEGIDGVFFCQSLVALQDHVRGLS